MTANNFSEIADEIEFSYWQVLMSELDSSLNRLKYISSADLKDAYENEQFNSFWDEVKANESIIVSVSDNADLYEIGDDSLLIVLVENVNNRMIVFDKQDKRKVCSLIQKSE
jgi:hypothetical protein